MNIQFNGHSYKPTLDSAHWHKKDIPNKDIDKPNNENKTENQKEEKELEELKKRDREVRTHEQAHMAAAQDLVIRGANYQYKKGSDGKLYAVSGDVVIDVSEGKTPKETLQKAKKIIKAALAPKDPSNKDKEVASKARKMEVEAKREITEEKIQEKQLDNNDNENNKNGKIKNYSNSSINNQSNIDYYA